MKRFALLASACAFTLTGCESTIWSQHPPHPNYGPNMLRSFAGELPLLTVGVAPENAEPLAEAMSGYHAGVALHFTPLGDTGASYGYRMVARIESARARTGDACRTGAPVRSDADAPGKRVLSISFCRGQRRFTGAATRIDDGQDFGSDAFEETVRSLMLAVFPKVRTSDSDDSGKSWTIR